MPVSPGLRGFGRRVTPNSSSVFDFGVAVNAKYDRFGCLPRTRRQVLAVGVSSSSAASRPTPSACFTRPPPPRLRRVRLVDDHRVPLAAELAPATLSSTNGNFCSVVMMIFAVESVERVGELPRVLVDLLHHAGVWSNW